LPFPTPPKEGNNWMQTYLNIELILSTMKQYFIYLLLILPSFLIAQHTVRVERCHSFPESEPINCLHIEGNLIWLGTSKGLFFYSYDKNRRNVLEDVSVTAIARDSTGRLWAAMEDGTIMTSDRQKKIDLRKKDFSPYITNMTTKFNQLWIATAEQGIFVWDIDKMTKIAHYTASNSKLPSNTVNFVQYDKKGTVWAGTTKGVCQIIGEKIKVFEKSDNITAVSNYANDIWFIGNKKLWKVDDESRWAQIRLDSRLSNGNVRDMAFDDEGRLYSASNIFSRYDIIADTMALYGKEIGYVSDQSLCVESDANGDIWVGTKKNGLFRFKLFFKEEVAHDDLTAICYSEKELACHGDTDGELNIKVSGGKPPYTYEWNNPACKGEKPNGLKAGNYLVTVTDAKGTEVIAGAQVMQPDALTFFLIELKHLSRPSAKDGAIEITGVGGTGKYDYTWENNSKEATRKRLKKGMYAVVIQDENKCTFGANFEVKGPRILPELATAEVEAGTTIPIDQLYFEADSTMFGDLSKDVLDEVYDFIKKKPNVKVEIGGHTNNLPSNEYCDWLSTERARSVAEYLYKKGISANQLSYKGYGKKDPIADNNSKFGRAKNQRVEVKVLAVK
jgi:outer membrane protein OmpA-like peptidoglycan-associated protein/frataxin-like iron-binding protein CyaY